jgi:hypothetical protein
MQHDPPQRADLRVDPESRHSPIVPPTGPPATTTRSPVSALGGWAAGSPTDLAELALVCPRHHTEVHAGTCHPETPRLAA